MLLLLWQPASGSGPAPAPLPIGPAEQIQTGGARFPQERYLRRKKKLKKDDEELIQLLAVVLPLIGRAR